MDKWIQFIIHYKVKSFWITLFMVILTSLSMRPSSACLTTSSTPQAIINLELAFDQREALMIKELWINNDCSSILSFSRNGLEAAIVNIFLDFPFLVSYTCFFIVLIVITQKRTGSNEGISTLLIDAALLTGLLDVVENIMMMIFLKVYSIPSYTFAIPASIKFGLVIVLIMVIVLRLVRSLVRWKS